MMLSNMPEDVMKIYHDAKPVNDTSKVFIQANDFKKVIKATKLIASKTRTHEEISEMFGFTVRQAYLYIAGCKYLDLVCEKPDKTGAMKLHVTKRGRNFARLTWSDRKLYLTSLEYMLENECFYQVFTDILENESMPGRVRVAEIMEELNVCKPAVINRRASSVIAWYRYILTELLGEGDIPTPDTSEEAE